VKWQLKVQIGSPAASASVHSNRAARVEAEEHTDEEAVER
jgi:hypothetical protein